MMTKTEDQKHLRIRKQGCWKKELASQETARIARNFNKLGTCSGERQATTDPNKGKTMQEKKPQNGFSLVGNTAKEAKNIKMAIKRETRGRDLQKLTGIGSTCGTATRKLGDA